MSKIIEYTQRAADAAAPYVKEAGECAAAAAASVRRGVRKSRRKAKRQMRMVKVKRFIELMTNLVLLAAAVIALVLVALEYIRRRSGE